MTGIDEYNQSKLNTILAYIEEHSDVRGFYGYLRTDKALTTIYQYIKNAQHLLEYANKNPSQLTLDDYTAYLSHISVKPDGSAVTSSYKIQQYHALKTYSTYLYESGVSKDNYMLHIKRPKSIESQITIEKRARSFLTKEELKVYINAVKKGAGTDKAKTCQKQMKERDFAIIMIFLTTGIRRSAMVKLDIEDVDIKNHKLWVTDKGSKVHAYDLNDLTFNAILDWLLCRNIFLQGNTTRALFLNKYGCRLKEDGIKEIVIKYAIDIDGKHITPHKLRATYGTQLYEATKDIYFVQRAMGHSSPTTTERYIRGQSNVTKEASDIMGNLF